MTGAAGENPTGTTADDETSGSTAGSSSGGDGATSGEANQPPSDEFHCESTAWSPDCLDIFHSWELSLDSCEAQGVELSCSPGTIVGIERVSHHLLVQAIVPVGESHTNRAILFERSLSGAWVESQRFDGHEQRLLRNDNEAQVLSWSEGIVRLDGREIATLADLKLISAAEWSGDTLHWLGKVWTGGSLRALHWAWDRDGEAREIPASVTTHEPAVLLRDPTELELPLLVLGPMAAGESKFIVYRLDGQNLSEWGRSSEFVPQLFTGTHYLSSLGAMLWGWPSQGEPLEGEPSQLFRSEAPEPCPTERASEADNSCVSWSENKSFERPLLFDKAGLGEEMWATGVFVREDYSCFTEQSACEGACACPVQSQNEATASYLKLAQVGRDTDYFEYQIGVPLPAGSPVSLQVDATLEGFSIAYAENDSKAQGATVRTVDLVR